MGKSDVLRTIVSLIDQAAFAATTFGTGVIIGRTLLEAEFSVYYLTMTVVIVLRNVQSELVTAPYSVFRQRYEGRQRQEYAGSVVCHQLVLSLTGVCVVLLMLLLAQLHWITPSITPTLWVMLGVMPFLLFRSFLRSFSFASYRFWAAVAIDLTVGLGQLLGLIGLYYFGLLTVPLAFAVMGASCLAGILVWIWTSPESLRFARSRVLPDWRNNWQFSKWALASQLTGTTSPYLVPWILESVHGESTTGVYGACFTIVGLSLHFVTAVANYLTPRAAAAFAAGGRGGLLHVLRVSTWLYLAVIGAICLGFAVLGDFPVQFVYGGTYQHTGWTCTLLAGCTLAISMSVVCGNGLWAVNRPDANMTADMATMVATLGAAAWLIGPWGKEGAAAAMFLGALTGALVRGVTLNMVLNSVAPERSSVSPSAAPTKPR